MKFWLGLFCPTMPDPRVRTQIKVLNEGPEYFNQSTTENCSRTNFQVYDLGTHIKRFQIIPFIFEYHTFGALKCILQAENAEICIFTSKKEAIFADFLYFRYV